MTTDTPGVRPGGAACRVRSPQLCTPHAARRTSHAARRTGHAETPHGAAATPHGSQTGDVAVTGAALDPWAPWVAVFAVLLGTGLLLSRRRS